METIRVCRAGYPTRKHFDEFLDRFGILAPSTLDKRFASLNSEVESLPNTVLKFLTFGLFLLVLMRKQRARNFWRQLDSKNTRYLYCTHHVEYFSEQPSLGI